jgi:hypothetical protein
MFVDAWRDAAAQRTVAGSARRTATAVLVSAVGSLALILPSGGALAKGPGGSGGSGGGGGGGGQSCSKKQTCTQAPPTVVISAPTSGATAAGTVTVAGTASDSSTVTNVVVSVDGTPPQPASGTSSWTGAVDTTVYANGPHTLTATATDSAGYVGSASLAIDVQNNVSSSPSAQVISNPAAQAPFVLLGFHRMAEQGTVTALLYHDLYFNPWAYFRDSSSGAYSNVALPGWDGNSSTWESVSYVWTAKNDLWVFGGSGPIYVRQYHLSGSPLPTSAVLVSTTTFGDADSRPGDFIQLASGGLLGVWRQQGTAGLPQGQGIAYRSTSGSWSTIYPLQFMPTVASYQVVAQQPTDGSIWVFCDPDAYHAIGAIHLTEGTSGISVDWTDSQFINVPKYGDNGPDPENPVLTAAPDASTGTIALAYEDNHRISYPTPSWYGSYVSVARIGADSSVSFVVLPIYVMRVSVIGLVVRPGETWLTYHPAQADGSYTLLYASRYASGSWDAPVLLGDAPASDWTAFGNSRAEFAARLKDDQIHYFAP